MEHTLAPYERQFSVEERKLMVAQTIGQLRKAKGLSQKETAALIGVTQATLSAYERGRNEPPVEIIVRLSYLFGCPVDILVQRDRLMRTSVDALEQLEDLRRKIAECEEQMAENGGDNPALKSLVDAMNRMADQMENTLRTDSAAQSFDVVLK